jgi:hypothetical protein
VLDQILSRVSEGKPGSGGGAKHFQTSWLCDVDVFIANCHDLEDPKP